MKRFFSFWFGLSCLLSLSACGSDDSSSNEFDPNAPISCDGEGYCPKDMWLCRPGIDNNYCRETQTATVYAPDGSTSEETLPKATKPKIDCFYVYPTVALSGPVGNVPDFSNVEDILVPLRAQAVPFSETCEVYAPFYHQTTFATFGSPDAAQYAEKAYEDVADAFQFYMKHYNRGRKFVLLSHSQGTQMMRRLLQRKFDDDASLRAQLLIALTLGPVNDITVPKGQLVGGSFKNLPMCSKPGETGCVVAYDSFADTGSGGLAPPTAESACVNPVNFSGDLARLKKSYFPTKRYAGQFTTPNNPDLPTTFSALADLFSAQCVRDANDRAAFYISFTPKAGDTRTNPIDFGSQLFHILDYSFPLRDLLDLVKARADSL